MAELPCLDFPSDRSCQSMGCSVNDWCAACLKNHNLSRTPCPDCAGKGAEIERLSLKLAPKFELEHMIAEQQRIDRFNALMAENTALRAVAEAARKLLSDLCDLMEQSRGVAGLHLNGDESSWEELTESADFGSWLGSIHAAQDALAALDGEE